MLLSCFDIALSTITWMQHIPFRVFLWNPNWSRTNIVLNMQHCLWVTGIQRWVFFLLIYHFIMFHVPEAIPQTPPTFQLPLELTFRLESILEVEQHISEPPHIIHQLHHILRVHSRRPHQPGRQPHAAQGVWVPRAAAHVQGPGGSGWQGSREGFGEVSWQTLGVLCPAATTAAAALP